MAFFVVGGWYELVRTQLFVGGFYMVDVCSFEACAFVYCGIQECGFNVAELICEFDSLVHCIHFCYPAFELFLGAVSYDKNVV